MGALRNSFVALAAATTLSGCGASAGVTRACTQIGVPVGVNVEVRAPFAEDVHMATLHVCWDGKCVTPPLELHTSSVAGDTTCIGNRPEDSCSAQVSSAQTPSSNADKSGFASIPDLPARPVEATLTLDDPQPREREIQLHPKMHFPNGPLCQGGGPQAGLVVSGDGSVHERP
jgi:hypothetical protein